MHGATKFVAACQTPRGWRRCQSRLQFWLQALAEGLRKGMNPRYSYCFQLRALICKRPAKVPGKEGIRHCSSGSRHLQKTWPTGLAEVRIATTVPAFACNGAAIECHEAGGAPVL